MTTIEEDEDLFDAELVVTTIEADEDVIDAELVEDVVELDPGLHRDIPAEVYHRDPVPGGSMSSSVARVMLPPSCPALARWQQVNPETKDAFDLGTVTHRLILGAGPDVVEIPYNDRRTKAAKEAITEAREAGAVPLLTKDLLQVRRMAEAVWAHPIAGRLLDPDRGGEPETVIVWQDPDVGIMRRAMLDKLRINGPGRPRVVDLKTTTSVSPRAISKTIDERNYHQQDPWYVDAVESLGVDDPAFLFVFVQKLPPHLVTVVQLPDEAVAQGRSDNRAAIDQWAECVEADDWPAFTDDIAYIGLPPWSRRNREENW